MAAALCKRIYVRVYYDTGVGRAQNWSHVLARIAKLWQKRESVLHCVLHFKPFIPRSKNVKLSIYRKKKLISYTLKALLACYTTGTASSV